MPSTGETVGQGRRQEFLTKLAECGSVKLAAKHAKVSRQTLYGLRNHDPEFRRLWDEARDLGDLALEDEAYERSIIGGSDGMLKFVLQKRLPERWGDVPKTINQNLSLRLMSPEQREKEAGRILLRIAALGIPLVSIDGEAIDISDIQAEAAADRAARAPKALNRPESPESPGFWPLRERESSCGRPNRWALAPALGTSRIGRCL